MSRKGNDLIYIRTDHAGFIPELGTSGPIIAPILCPISRCTKMLSAGLILFEVNPSTGACIRLSIHNIGEEYIFGAPTEDVKFNIDQPVNPEVLETTGTASVSQSSVIDPLQDPNQVQDNDADDEITDANGTDDGTDDAETASTEDTSEDKPAAAPQMTKAQRKAAKVAAEKAAAEKAATTAGSTI